MLGRLQLPVTEAIMLFREFSKDVFSDKKWWWQNETFKATKMKDAVKRIVASSGRPTDEPMFDTNGVCKT
jgi:hypothetical protein